MTFDATVGGANSNSYGTVAEADAYFSDRMTGDWDSSEVHKEQYLVKATQYLDAVYAGLWAGVKATSAQALAWPRYDVLDSDGYSIASDIIPEKLKYATFEAAKIIAGGVNLQEAQGRKTTREKVGELEIEYSEGSIMSTRYPAVDGYLRDFIKMGASVAGQGGFANVFMIRA